MKVSKEQITRKALLIFAENDYNSVSLNDIARDLEITKGAIYHYFSSKDELFRDSVSYMFNQMGSMMEESFNPDIDLKTLIEAFFQLDSVSEMYASAIGMDFARDYSNLVYLMFTAFKKFPDLQAVLSETYNMYMNMLSELFQKGQSDGVIRADLDARALAFEVTAYIEGGMLVGAVCSDLDTGNLARGVFDNFWKRIAEG